MKTSKFISFVISFALVAFFGGCQKEPGPGGQSHIHGHVEYHEAGEEHGEHVEDGLVSIWYGVTSVGDPSSGFDNQAMTNSEGEFEFEHLTKGDYYLYAKWTDSTITTRTGSTAVTIKEKAEEVDVHIEVE